MANMFFRFIILVFFLGLGACNSSAVKDAKELIDIADGVPRKTIDTSRLGTNAFVNDPRFGSIRNQFLEVRDTLGLKFVRVLFLWNDAVQPSPGSSIDFSFYDEIISKVPRGLDVLVVLDGIPGWLTNPANQVGGNPRVSFAELFVRKVAERYGSNAKIVGFEIWNEPNIQSNNNITLDILTNPVNYVEMLAAGYSAVKDVAPSKLVLNAATTAINQNFPDTLNYNRAMRDAGAQAFTDKWNIHYYGRQFERVTTSGGVAGFLNSLAEPKWVTESGIQGVNEQLAYGEEAWPFLRDNIVGIERIYQYQLTEATPAASSFGLRTLDPANPVSDLYIHLRDRAAAG